jgi:hypothetical protein
VKIKVAVLALIALLAMATLAEGAYQLRFGYAKRAISRFTSGVCNELEGCSGWRVGPCRRRSLHRIDCLSTVRSRQGGGCKWVTIAVLPPTASDVILHHKRILC